MTWGAGPTVGAYLDLFSPDGSLFDSGMPAPVSGDDIRTTITNTLQLLDGIQLDAIRTGRNDTTLFVEANDTATIQGTPTSWTAVYCMAASGDRVARGRRYYDQVSVLRSVLGRLPAEESDEHVGPLELSPTETGHGSAGCWFREWVGTAGPVGHHRSISAIERFADGDIAVFTDTLNTTYRLHTNATTLVRTADVIDVWTINGRCLMTAKDTYLDGTFSSSSDHASIAPTQRVVERFRAVALVAP